MSILLNTRACSCAFLRTVLRSNKRITVYPISKPSLSLSRFYSSTQTSLPVTSPPLPVTSASAAVPIKTESLPIQEQQESEESDDPLTKEVPHHDESQLDFTDTKEIFKHKSTLQLIRAYFVFLSCSIRPLVRNSGSLLSLSYKILGDKLTDYLVRQTFFAHFCGGTSSEDLKPVIKHLEQSGIGAILDFAAENDVVTNPTGTVARVYTYEGEMNCDRNMYDFLKSIETAGKMKEGFTAIKVTALGNPELLKRMSIFLLQIRRLFEEFDRDNDARINFDDFRKGLAQRSGKSHDDVPLPEESTLRHIFQQFDPDRSGFIDHLTWTSKLKLADIDNAQPMDVWPGSGLLKLTDEEKILIDALMARLARITEAAVKNNVRLLVDAEQSYYQPAIDQVALNLQRRYNKTGPHIFNTYQCYMTHSEKRITNDLNRAKREGFWFAGKLVRGAYMEQERSLAQKNGVESPIFSTIEETHANYNKMLEEILKFDHKTNLMVASHNQETVEITTRLMKKYPINAKRRIFFGQLFGMADNLTYTLGHHGYSVYKYLPYGPVHEVVPYLIRRAQENAAVLDKAKFERSLVWREIKTRLFAQ